MKDERLYLYHIIEANERLGIHFKGGKVSFLKDPTVQDAVIKVLANITESADKISTKTKQAYLSVPWPMIKSFRNVLVHDYLGDLDYEEVWDIIDNDLPTLVDAARTILREKYGEER